MLRPRIYLTAAGLSAVAAIASVAIAWPSAIAQSSLKLTAKQAALKGMPATARHGREENVSKLIVKMRASSSELAQSMAVTHMRSLSSKAGFGIKSITPMNADASLITLDSPLPLSQATALAARLASDPNVEYAEPDFLMRPFLTPNDQEFTSKQWNLLSPTATYSGALAVTPAVPT